jgi:hypothetical protein
MTTFVLSVELGALVDDADGSSSRWYGKEQKALIYSSLGSAFSRNVHGQFAWFHHRTRAFQ